MLRRRADIFVTLFFRAAEDFATPYFMPFISRDTPVSFIYAAAMPLPAPFHSGC